MHRAARREGLGPAISGQDSRGMVLQEWHGWHGLEVRALGAAGGAINGKAWRGDAATGTAGTAMLGMHWLCSASNGPTGMARPPMVVRGDQRQARLGLLRRRTVWRCAAGKAQHGRRSAATRGMERQAITGVARCGEQRKAWRSSAG